MTKDYSLHCLEIFKPILPLCNLLSLSYLFVISLSLLLSLSYLFNVSQVIHGMGDRASDEDLASLSHSMINLAMAFSITPERSRTIQDVNRASENTLSSLHNGSSGTNTLSSNNNINSFKTGVAVEEERSGRIDQSHIGFLYVDGSKWGGLTHFVYVAKFYSQLHELVLIGLNLTTLSL